MIVSPDHTVPRKATNKQITIPGLTARFLPLPQNSLFESEEE